MKKQIIYSLVFILLLVLGMYALVILISYLDDQPSLFDETQIYTIVQDENTCLLRLENITDGKSVFIAGTSNKKTRQYLNQNVQIKGKFIYTKLKRGSIPLLGRNDNCRDSNNPPYMQAVYIDSLVKSPL